jgi:hypothetical protein
MISRSAPITASATAFLLHLVDPVGTPDTPRTAPETSHTASGLRGEVRRPEVPAATLAREADQEQRDGDRGHDHAARDPARVPQQLVFAEELRPDRDGPAAVLAELTGG